MNRWPRLSTAFRHASPSTSPPACFLPACAFAMPASERWRTRTGAAGRMRAAEAVVINIRRAGDVFSPSVATAFFASLIERCPLSRRLRAFLSFAPLLQRQRLLHS